jgi:hypothetical protein
MCSVIDGGLKVPGVGERRPHACEDCGSREVITNLVVNSTFEVFEASYQEVAYPSIVCAGCSYEREDLEPDANICIGDNRGWQVWSGTEWVNEMPDLPGCWGEMPQD